MVPGLTTSPPNFFTPSRFPGESRPFLVVPPAFLVAHRTCPASGKGAATNQGIDGITARLTSGVTAKAARKKLIV
jgi:hypothetical protein